MRESLVTATVTVTVTVTVTPPPSRNPSRDQRRYHIANHLFLLDDLVIYAIIPLPKHGRMYVMSAQEEGPIPKIQPPVAISHPSRQSHVTILQSRQREETITSTLLIAASNLSFLFFWQFVSPQVQSRTSDSYNSITKVARTLLLQVPDTYTFCNRINKARPLTEPTTSVQNTPIKPILTSIHPPNDTTLLPSTLQSPNDKDPAPSQDEIPRPQKANPTNQPNPP